MAGEEIDIQAELKQLEKEQQAKRKVCIYSCKHLLHD